MSVGHRKAFTGVLLMPSEDNEGGGSDTSAFPN